MQEPRFAGIEQRLDRALDLLAETPAIVSGLACFATISLVVMETVARYTDLFRMTLSEEYTGYLLVMAATLGAGSSIRSNIFPRLMVIVRLLPERVRSVLDFLGLLAGLLVNGVYTVLSWQLLQQSIKLRATAWSVMHTPLAIPQGIMVFGFGLFEVVLLGMVIRSALSLARDKKYRSPTQASMEEAYV